MSENITSLPSEADDVLVRVEGVGKRFCRNLKKSLFYGIQDITSDLLGRDRSESTLREDEFYANQGISFELRRGECLGLIGHNGAGKTTLLKMLNGLIKPDSGTITMRGRIGALIALGAGFNPILTGRENVYVAGSVLGLTKQEIDDKYDEIVAFAELEDSMESPVQNYSSGMQVRLGFAVATAMKPDVLLLDEVLAVGDVGFQAKCFNALAELRKKGVPFILVSHNMRQILRYCEKVVYLEHGEVKFHGDTQEGISHFLDDMNKGSASSSVGPDWSIVDGSGKVKFTAARFLNSDNNEVSSIRSGDPVILEIDYEKHSSEIGNPFLDVVVRHRGELLFQSTSRGVLLLDHESPRCGSLRVQFLSLPANVDYVDFYFSIHEETSCEILDWKRDFRLFIDRNENQTGLLSLNVVWNAKGRVNI
jgi:lipopolysaccharide transport system ATP-binding protein